MPTYPLKNEKTGETKEVNMSMVEYSQFLKDNPDWKKDWSVKPTMIFQGRVTNKGHLDINADTFRKGTQDYDRINS